MTGCQTFNINDVDNCSCHTLQGEVSRVDIPQDYCLAFIGNGLHNFTQSDNETLTAMTKDLPTGEPCCSTGGSQSQDDNSDSSE